MFIHVCSEAWEYSDTRLKYFNINLSVPSQNESGTGSCVCYEWQFAIQCILIWAKCLQEIDCVINIFKMVTTSLFFIQSFLKIIAVYIWNKILHFRQN